MKQLSESLNYNSDINELRKYSKLKGALKAYFDTNLVESYDEPLVIE
jgi:hypothetical protein